MSMISSLIDELNKSADEWNSSNMFELARMCREAADTISELRGTLQVASVDHRHLSDELSAAKHDLSVFSGRIVELNAENARLRNELESVGTAAYMYGRGDLKAENAKLRELVIAQCECVKHDDCNECFHYSEGKCMFPFKSMYRELGVEVTA